MQCAERSRSVEIFEAENQCLNSHEQRRGEWDKRATKPIEFGETPENTRTTHGVLADFKVSS